MKYPSLPLVGLLVDADPRLLVGLLGTWKAGCGFVPLDPRAPVERNRGIAEDCGLRVLVTVSDHLPRARELAGLLDGMEDVICLDGDPDGDGSGVRLWGVSDLAGEEGGEQDGGRDGEPAPPALDGAGPAYVLYTSGSTGEPKGVVVTHGNLAPLLEWSREALGLDARTRVLQTLAHTFDFGLFEVVTTLLSGGTLVQLDREDRLDPAAYARAVREHGITILHTTPSLLREVAPVAGRVPSLETVHLGGEVLTGAVVEAASAMVAEGGRILNGYGPTETTINATLQIVEPGAEVPVGGGGAVSIGRASAANRCYVLDSRLSPLPPGAAGELCIGGPGVALGYLGRPARTAERFLPDPWADRPGARLYRSGDLVRRRPGGGLDFLGRIDRQVKVRGFRIEPGEVEWALCRHPRVESAAAAVRGGLLVAWVVGREGEPPDGNELRDHLRRLLPGHMVPAAYVAVEALPRTAHGKLDEAGLPEPELELAGDRNGPRTPTEEVVLAVCADELGGIPLGVHDDLFNAGAHSILAMRIVTRLREVFQTEIPLVTLFEHPTVEGLSQALDDGVGGRALPPLTARPPEMTELPLSYNQEGVWLVYRMDPDSVAYNVPRSLRMTGPLSRRGLEHAFTSLVERHEILRSTFHEEVDGMPVQRVHPPYRVAIPVVDLSRVPGERRMSLVRTLTVEEGQRPFDMEHGPMIRLHLLRLSQGDNVLVVCEHHLVHDGWTQGVLVRDFLAYYRSFVTGEEPDLPALQVQYGDFALWQRRWLDRSVLQPQLDWWKEKLEGAPQLLELPTDFPRPAIQSTRGEEVEAELPGELGDALRELAQRTGTTLFMVLLAAFQALLHRYGAQDDLVIGTAAANRRLRNIEGILGMVINSLVLRTDMGGGADFRDLLERTRRTCLEAYGRQDLPFDWLVEALQPERILSHQPLFQVMFSTLDTPMPPLDLPDLELELLHSHNRSSKWDFDLMAVPHREQQMADFGGGDESASGLTLVLEYSTDLYEEVTMERLLGHYRTFLEAVVEDAGRPLRELPLMPPWERRQVLEEWAVGPALEVSSATVVERLLERARTDGGAPALDWEGTTYDLSQLVAAMHATALRLRRAGVGPDSVVAIRTGRSPDMVVGMLGVLRAGGAYLPLDPALPADRVRRMAEEAGARWWIGEPDSGPDPAPGLERVAAAPIGADPTDTEPGMDGADLPLPDPAHLAYVMFTSGSTGEPKGVAIPHGGLDWYVRVAGELYGMGPHRRVLQFSTPSFDVSVEEIFPTLAWGGTLVLHPDPTILSAAEVMAFCARRRVNLVSLPTAWWHHLAAEVGAGRVEIPEVLDTVVVGGEKALAERVEEWRGRVGQRLTTFNTYGPTETTVVVTAHRIEPRRTGRRAEIPIGRPLPEVRAYLLDSAFQPVAAGLPGELFLGCPGIARGYLGRPAATAAAFVPDPVSGFPGARLYRTGDQARFLPDGQLEFLARRDGQVKIRGFRVEPGEVEAALVAHPEVDQAVVVPFTGASGERRLAAYVAADPDRVGERALRELLLERVPQYMVPTLYVHLPELPLTPQGKVDRGALPEPRERRQAAPATLEAPRTPLEDAVAALWAEVLDRSRVGVGEDFFALGGHSLSGARLIARVRTVFGVELPLRRLFQDPTVAAMARAIAEQRASGLPALRPPRPVPRDGELPLSFAQQRLWFLDQLEPASAAYNLAGAYRLRGELRLAALVAAFRHVVGRHEVLRTTYPSRDGRPRQEIASEAGPPPAVVDLSALTDPRAVARRLARAEAARPFDLARGPILRVRLLRLAARDHLLVVNLHHIAGDGWSIALLAEDVRRAYGAALAATPVELPELPVQYADYSAWQRDWLRGERLAAEVEWWREGLAGADAELELPADRSRPAVRRYRGASLPLHLPLDLVGDLESLARERSATLFMVFLAAFDALLVRYAGRDDLVVGTPVAGRRFPELEGLVGFFVNTLVLRTSAAGDPSFAGLLDRVRQTVLEADAHQDLPFERLVEELEPDRNLSRSPLFQVMLAFLDVPERLEMPDLEVEPWSLDTGTSKFDWTLLLNRSGDGAVAGTFGYDTDLFDRSTAQRVVRHYRTLLQAAVRHPELPLSRLSLLSAAERDQLLVEWSGAGRKPALPAATLHAAFEAWARAIPDALAVASPDGDWTYGELDRRAVAVAAELRDLGVGPEVRVGILARRTPQLLAAILGVLKAGGAYVPLDPSYPQERLAFMVEDSGATVVLGDAAVLADAALGDGEALAALGDLDTPVAVRRLEDLGEGGGGAPDLPSPPPQALAYVIYTSGSTGRPKGVGITHASAAALLGWSREVFTDDELSAVLAATSVCFDLSVWELFVPLAWGGAVVLVPDALHPVVPGAPPARLLNTVPSAAAELLRSGGLPPSVRTVNLAGEVLPVPLVEALHSAGVERVLNLYGPSEDTTYSTWVEVPRGAVPTIGRPVPGTSARVLDRHGHPVPVGVAGELCLGGAGLARGYLGRPSRTALSFVPDPFAGQPGGRLYRTGDRARWLPSGELEFLGRLDAQVKVRGFRIEPGEVEALLLAHSGVHEAAVVAREMEAGDLRLVAYLAVGPGVDGPGADELREMLGTMLPRHMVPSLFVSLPELPHTPSGKIDRRALPEPRIAAAGARTAPRGPAEEMVAAVWEEVLGVEGLGAGDDFFALGGHSLLAAQVAARLRQAFGIDLPLRAVFQARTVAGLAARLEAARRRGGARPLPPLVPVSRDGAMPLSFSQQRLWFLDQLQPDNPFYNVPGSFRVRGAVEPGTLAGALADLVRRHETLRTHFPAASGQPEQRVSPAPRRHPLPLVDLSACPPGRARRVARELAVADARRPFDLEAGPLLRVALVRLSQEEHAVVLTLHHVVSDLWSVGVLVDELAALYAARRDGSAPDLPPLPVQYADYVHWQHRCLTGPALEAQRTWWRDRLSPLPPVLELPFDRPRPPVQSHRGGLVEISVPASTAGALEELGRQRGATTFMATLAAFAALLGRLSRQGDVAVGVPVAGRDHVELEGLVGLFLNTLILRLDPAGEGGFAALLDRVREASLDAFAHGDVPFEMLVEELQPQRALSHSPLFQVLFVMQSRIAREQRRVPGLEIEPLEVESGTSKFDLTLLVDERGEGLDASFEYARDLFDGSTVERMARHWRALLEAAVAAPDVPLARLPLLAEAERTQVLREWNDTVARYPDADTLDSLFAAAADRWPQRVAVEDGESALTYAELDARANQLAHRLRGLGVGADGRVALLVERSVGASVAVLGILKAGAAYVPLDPAYPADRLAFMVEDAASPVLVAQRHLVDLLPSLPARVLCPEDDPELARQPRETPAPAGHPDHLAYVMYTSGSTGRPKGIGLPHRCLTNLVHWHLRVLEPGARMMQFSSMSFDVSFHEMFATWLSGGTLVVVAEAVRPDMLELARFLDRERIEKAILPVVVLQQLAEVWAAGEPLPSHLREVTTTGEALHVSAAARDLFRRLPGCRLHNHYGPAETHVVTALSLPPDPDRWESHPTVGRPIANTSIFLLDQAGAPVPVGVAGELQIGGVSLARGYLDRPALTAARFVPDPVGGDPGARLYRTGDLARWRRDGEVEFLGRLDHQLKIRGFRVEPGEVESVLGQHPAVRDSFVMPVDPGTAEARLVAYVVAGSDDPPSPAALRDHLRERLPEYMVPSAFVNLDVLPLTPNKKVDRAALPVPREERSEALVAPRNALEEIVADLWGEVLGLPEVGVFDDFFASGGHSLLATQLISRIRRALEVELPLRRVFENPTVAGIAEALEREWSGGALPAAPPFTREPRDGGLPLSFAQERLWFLDQLEPGNPFYNVPWRLRLAGDLRPPVLRTAVEALVDRHEILRTTYARQGEGPVQVVHPAGAVPLPVVDLAALAAQRREQEGTRLTRAEARRPFRLAEEPPLRMTLLRLEADQHLILITLHHIAVDGWSNAVLTRELAAFYGAAVEGRSAALPELPFQYADFAAWQRRYLDGEVRERHLGWWRTQLDGAPTLLELPADRPRPEEQTFRGAALDVDLGEATGEALEALCRRRGVTPFMALLAGFQAVVHQRTGLTDYLLATDVANRNRLETEGLIGFFVNALVLRADLRGNPTFAELLGRVRETTLGAYAHQDLPFATLVEELHPERNLSHMPLVQVAFTVQNVPPGTLSLPDVELSVEHVDERVARFDLAVHLAQRNGRVRGVAEYSSDLFDRATIEALVDDLGTLLASAMADPEQRLADLAGRLADREERRDAETVDKLRASGHMLLKRLRPRELVESE